MKRNALDAVKWFGNLSIPQAGCNTISDIFFHKLKTNKTYNLWNKENNKKKR